MAEETKLTSAEFAAKIKAKYSQYAAIPDDELTEKIVSKHPEYAGKVILSSAKPAPVVDPNNPYPELQNAKPTGRVGHVAAPEPNVEATLNTIPALGGAVGGVLGGGIPGAALGGGAGEALKELIQTAATGKPAESPVTDIALQGGIQGGAEGLGKVASWAGGKIAPMAPQALARILRLGPKAFQWGREPAEEVLTRGLATGNLKEMVGNIGEASKQVTSELNTALKNAPGTVDVFDAATEASKSIPNPAAASRFEQTVLDAADKLGLKNLDKLTNTEANALKQEVARQARFVEGDLRPSVASAAKVFGGKVKDGLIANVPEAEHLLDSSANLTEASKAGEHAVRMEKAGRTESGLSAVDIKKPSTYPRLATDTITGARTLFNMANMLKDHTSMSNALRLAFQIVYPDSQGEQ